MNTSSFLEEGKSDVKPLLTRERENLSSSAASGKVRLTTRQLTAKGGAQVFTTTFGSGKAGDLTVNASETIDLLDPNNQGTLLTTGLFTSLAQTASGNGGNINIATGDLNIRDGATVTGLDG